VVELISDGCEEEVGYSLKRRREEPVGEGKDVPAKAVHLQSEGWDLLQLLDFWSDP